MGPTAQIRALTAATDMPVHRIGRGNAVTRSTHVVHAYWNPTFIIALVQHCMVLNEQREHLRMAELASYDRWSFSSLTLYCLRLLIEQECSAVDSSCHASYVNWAFPISMRQAVMCGQFRDRPNLCWIHS